MSKNKTTFTVVINTTKIPKGHRPHKSGAGTHSSETNRLRTRSAKNNRAIREFDE